MKYVGSKARIAKDIAPIINKLIKDNGITTYIEPFVGGANMIEHIDCAVKFGYDSNEFLIEFLRAISYDGWNPLETLPKEKMTKELYETVKNNKELFQEYITGLVGFCASYNAKWFGGYAGEVKTKIGTTRNYYVEAVKNVLKQAERLKRVNFIHRDYITLYPEGAFIYCDPPYEGVTGYKDSFNHFEYWEWVRNVSKNNIVLCSEYNAPPDFKCIWQKQITTTLDKNSRSKPIEKLFTLNEVVL